MSETNNRRQQVFIGWDVGGWNCDKNTRSRDALVVLDGSGSDIGEPWRGNLRRTINDSSTSREFLSAVLNHCSLIREAENVYATIAIDAPLAFPKALVWLIERGKPLDHVGNKSAENPYLFRFTERRLASAGIIRPLSPIKDMIGSQATKAMHLISRFNLQQIELGVWSDNDCLTVIETYPSLCRVRLNGTQDKQTPKKKGAEADISDARICAQIARKHQLRPESLEPPPQNAPEAEGWIWGPLP